MTQVTNLFVVYDPTREEQSAFKRAAEIAEELSARLHVFACIYSNTTKSAGKSDEVQRLIAEQQDILDRAVAPLTDRGIEVITEVDWDKDWPQAVARASIRHSADIVLKSSYKHGSGKRALNKSSDRTLIRECRCPVLLVKEGTPRDVPKHRVLAAVDICAKNESYERLNQNVIDFSKKFLDTRGAEVHYVNAFQDFKGMPSRRELIEESSAESDKIHIKLGNPEKVIVDQAKILDVSLVVIGNSARSGLSAAFLGNTVEKVLDNVECDVLSLP
jgi:universal stress protein E